MAHAFRSTSFWLGILAFVTCFFISRYPLYTFFPYTDFQGDTSTYFQVVEQLKNGEWPSFWIRTPGYPFFIYVMLTLSGQDVMGVVFGQSVLCFMSSIFFIYAFHGLGRIWGLVAGVVLAGFSMLNSTLLHEFMLYSDSLASSLLLITMGWFVIALKSRQAWCFLIYSIFSGCLIYTRPASVYLLVIVALLFVYLWRNGYSKRCQWMLLTPVLTMIFSLCIYNYFRDGYFTFSQSGTHTRLFATSWYLEESTEYPEFVNTQIRESLATVTDADRQLFEKTWNLEQIRWRWHHYTEVSVYPFFPDTNEWRPWINRITSDAIKRHPEYFLKHFIAMMNSYFFMNPTMDNQFYLSSHFQHELKMKQREKGDGYKYAVLPHPDSSMYTYSKGNHWIEDPNDLYLKVYAYMVPFLKNIAWPFILLATFIVSLLEMYKTRGREFWPFFVFLLCLSDLGAAMVISLSVPPFLRYSYPYDLLYYLCPFFLVKLLLPGLGCRLKNMVLKTWNDLNGRQKLRTLVISSLSFILFSLFSLRVVDHYIRKLASSDLSVAVSSIANGNAQNLLYFGQEFMKMGDVTRAIDAYSEILKFSPSHEAAKIGLSMALFRIQEYAHAEWQLRQLLGNNPKNQQAWFLLGNQMNLRGDQKGMVNAYIEARHQNPDFHPAKFSQLDEAAVKAWNQVFSNNP